MRINWGTKIAIFYLSFVAGMMYLVVRSSQQSIDLVSEDYYADELQYQQRIDQSKRTAALATQPDIAYEHDVITVKLPAEFNGKTVNGKILLYCPARASDDQQTGFSTREGIARLSVPEKNSGYHEVQVSWEVNGERYFAAKKLFIP